jgi:hypothetical protein
MRHKDRVPARENPEIHLARAAPSAPAAQTRIVSVARIWLDPRHFAPPFKGDNFSRRFCVRVLHAQPRSLVSVGHVWVAELSISEPIVRLSSAHFIPVGVLFMNVVPVAAFAVSALSGIVPTPVQLAGAAITVAALVMNNLYQRRRVQRESASPYGHTAAANYLRRKPN